MPVGAKTGGLIIPDVFQFSNAGIKPTTGTFFSNKEVNSLYGKASLGYKSMLYIDATYRKDWSSALPKTAMVMDIHPWEVALLFLSL